MIVTVDEPTKEEFNILVVAFPPKPETPIKFHTVAFGTMT
jgi:hypothetical protein